MLLIQFAQLHLNLPPHQRIIPRPERFGICSGSCCWTYTRRLFVLQILHPVDMTLNTGVAFAEHVSWRYFFYLNVPLVGIAALCVALFLDVKVPVTTRQEKLKVMDWMCVLFVVTSTDFGFPSLSIPRVRTDISKF